MDGWLQRKKACVRETTWRMEVPYFLTGQLHTSDTKRQKKTTNGKQEQHKESNERQNSYEI